jgi:hypothetical protein
MRSDATKKRWFGEEDVADVSLGKQLELRNIRVDQGGHLTGATVSLSVGGWEDSLGSKVNLGIHRPATAARRQSSLRPH